MKAIRALSLEPFEIVVRPRPIAIDLRVAVNRDSAEGGVSVRGARGRVRLSNKGRRITWSPSETLAPGHYALVLSELRSNAEELLVGDLEVPFQVVASRSPVSAGVVVEHAVRLRLGKVSTIRLAMTDLPSGAYIELMKGHKRGSKQRVGLAFDQRGRRVNPEKLIGALRVRRIRKLGKLHAHLVRRLEKVSADTRTPVAVWLRPGRGLQPRRELELRQSRRRHPPADVVELRGKLAVDARDLATRLEVAGARDVRADLHAPAVNASLTVAQIRRVARWKEVVSVFLRDPRGIDDLADSIAIANSDVVHGAGTDGDDVRVAVWERGPDDTTNLQIEDQYSTDASSTHARLTHAIIKNVEANAPNGHAPACLLYSANDYDLDALAWALDDPECTVISQSFHRDAEQTDDEMSYDDIYKDWVALRWPWPTIVQASGNDANPDVEFVNHKGYNSLGVGSHNDGASAMAATSVFRNPASDHGDRELPEICANGTGVTAAGETNGGTSFAAPVVAGIAALLQDANTRLSHWPEGNRAILLAGARRNVKDGTWWHDVSGGVDAADGSGAADAYQSYLISKSKQPRDNQGSRRGWDTGLLGNADFRSNTGEANFVHRILVPSVSHRFVWLTPRHVKVALAWTSRVSMLDDLIPWWPLPEIPVSSVLTVDLDLLIRDSAGQLVAFSSSYDNSYEIAEFDGTPGETYEIHIRRWSGNENTWYGVAWTVTGGLELIRFPQRLARAVTRALAP